MQLFPSMASLLLKLTVLTLGSVSSSPCVLSSIYRSQKKPEKNQRISLYHTISNAKGIYIDLLTYFQSRPDKLFIVVTAPPVSNGEWADNARLFNNWLVHEWLINYTPKNVGVFDLYNILTSNGGSPTEHDANQESGNHHRCKEGMIQHTIGEKCNTNQYPVNEGDDHPGPAGNRKATAEFTAILNGYYNTWYRREGQG